MEIELSNRQKVAAVSVVVFLGLAFSDAYILVHEAGHWTGCELQGGQSEFNQFEQGPGVTCHGVESEWSSVNYGFFYVSGILAEASIAVGLLAYPLTRVLGGLTVFKIGGSFAFTALYSHDLSALMQILHVGKVIA